MSQMGGDTNKTLTEYVDMLLKNKPSSYIKNYYIKNSEILNVYHLAQATVINAFALDNTLKGKLSKLEAKAKSGNDEGCKVCEDTLKKAKEMLEAGNNSIMKSSLDKLLETFNMQQKNQGAEIFSQEGQEILQTFNKKLKFREERYPYLNFISGVISLAQEYESSEVKKANNGFKMNPVSALLACSYVAQSLAICNPSDSSSKDTSKYNQETEVAKDIDVYLEAYIIALIKYNMVETTVSCDSQKPNSDLGTTARVRKDAVAIAEYIFDKNNTIAGAKGVPQRIVNAHRLNAHLVNRTGEENTFFIGLEATDLKKLIYFQDGEFYNLFQEKDREWVGEGKSVVELLQDAIDKNEGKYYWSALKRVQFDLVRTGGQIEKNESLKDNFASREVLNFCLDTLLYCKALGIEGKNPGMSERITKSLLQPLTVAMDTIVDEKEMKKIVNERIAHVSQALKKAGISYTFVKSKKELTDEQKEEKLRLRIAKAVAVGIIKEATQNDELLLVGFKIFALVKSGYFKAGDVSKQNQIIIDSCVNNANPYAAEFRALKTDKILKCTKKNVQKGVLRFIDIAKPKLEGNGEPTQEAPGAPDKEKE